jgi:hypothetical protein
MPSPIFHCSRSLPLSLSTVAMNSYGSTPYSMISFRRKACLFNMVLSIDESNCNR